MVQLLRAAPAVRPAATLNSPVARAVLPELAATVQRADGEAVPLFSLAAGDPILAAAADGSHFFDVVSSFCGGCAFLRRCCESPTPTGEGGGRLYAQRPPSVVAHRVPPPCLARG